jgi:hypothetical protein
MVVEDRSGKEEETMSTPTVPGTPTVAAAPSVAPAEDPYRFGYRYVRRVGPDGREEWEQVGLTLEDVLHPQEDDHISENTVHNDERDDLKKVCRLQLAGVPGALVLSDCIIDWGPGGPNPLCPDVAVIFDVADPPRKRGTFHVAEEKTRPCLVVEIVSPHTRSKDVVDKVQLYHQADVRDYVIVDQEREGGPRGLIHYRHAPGGYVEVPAGADGCVPLAPVRLRVGLRDNRIVVFDAVTGAEVVMDYVQAEQGRRAAVQRAEDAEKRLQDLEAELRRLRGDSTG